MSELERKQTTDFVSRTKLHLHYALSSLYTNKKFFVFGMKKVGSTPPLLIRKLGAKSNDTYACLNTNKGEQVAPVR